MSHTAQSTNQPEGAELRREPRAPTTGAGWLHWKGRSVEVIVRNVSDSGAQLQVSESLNVPEMVRLAGDTWECLGWTRYCTKQGSKFVVGIEIVGQPYLRESCEYRG